MTIAICDDNITICAKFEKIVAELKEETGDDIIVTAFYCGEKLMECIKNGNSFDLIFLDIELASINGVQVGQFIRQELDDYTTKIIYISSKDSYDRQLFDVQPLHFLSKPLQKAEIIADIKLAGKILGRENNLFAFKIGNETRKVLIDKILYFESSAKKIKLVTTKDSIEFYGAVATIPDRVKGHRFIQPHRAFVVNYEFISSINGTEIVMVNGDKIPISRNRAKDIRAHHLAYEKEEK